MPSRLLYVGSQIDPWCLRLDARPTLKPYIALSHCWGDVSAIFTTTKATFEDRLLEIPWSKLPKSFQDAISITRAIHVEYLWIDSLCIIQDDSEDWKAESVKMAEVYSGAYLTIFSNGSVFGRSQVVSLIGGTKQSSESRYPMPLHSYKATGFSKPMVSMPGIPRQLMHNLQATWTYL